MRICTDNQQDQDYDPRPRRVWSNDAEVLEPWSIADEFRRVVILTSGQVLNGAVYIQRIKEDNTPDTSEPTVSSGDSGFVGMFEPDTGDASAEAKSNKGKKARK